MALHCATALALLWFFRADWVRIIRGLIVSALRDLRERRLGLQTADERPAWMIVIATIPVRLTGIALEHTFRTLFAKPAAAAVFLFINGLVLLAAERLRRARPRPDTRSAAAPAEAMASVPAVPARVTAAGAAGQGRHRAHARQAGGRESADIHPARTSDARIARLSFADSFWVGLLQITALLAGSAGGLVAGVPGRALPDGRPGRSRYRDGGGRCGPAGLRTLLRRAGRAANGHDTAVDAGTPEPGAEPQGGP